jgi:predicted TIM-barrel fold metal-dependent hydrolase
MSARPIDFYTHASSLKYVDFVEKHERKPFFFRAQYERLKTLTRWKERLNLLDRNGIDAHVLVPMPFLESFPRIFNDAALAREGARLINNEIADFVSQEPKRFKGVAVLPTTDPELMVDELHRAVKELGFVGACCAVGPTCKRMDHAEMQPLYKAIIDLDTTLWLHPMRPPLPEYADEETSQFGAWNTIGWLYDTTSAMYRIVFAGVFDRYPGIRIVTHHHGALLPAHSWRLNVQWSKAEAQYPTSITKPYIDHFKKFHCDTAVFGYAPKVLELALEFFGPNHVLFGSDSPFDVDDGQHFTKETLRSIDGMAIPSEMRSDILCGNAKRILGTA